MSAETLKNEDFESEVLASDIPVLVDFFATWCGPCRMLAPTLEELEGEYEGKVKFYKVDIDEEPELATAYGVMSIPTLILFRDGKPAATSIGVRPRDELEDFLNG